MAVERISPMGLGPQGAIFLAEMSAVQGPGEYSAFTMGKWLMFCSSEIALNVVLERSLQTNSFIVHSRHRGFWHVDVFGSPAPSVGQGLAILSAKRVGVAADSPGPVMLPV